MSFVSWLSKISFFQTSTILFNNSNTMIAFYTKEINYFQLYIVQKFDILEAGTIR